MKKIKGYVSSRLIDGKLISQKIQNLVIREFCKKNNLFYNLSNVEYIYNNCFVGLYEIIEKINEFHGVVAFSFHQLPKNDDERKKIFLKFIKLNKIFYFSNENYKIHNIHSFENLELIIQIHKCLNNEKNYWIYH